MKLILLLLLSLLIIIPIYVFKYAKKNYPKRRYLITGIATGLIITPFSFGMYSFYYIPYIGLIPGMIGLILMLFHIKLGEHLVNYLGMEVAGMILFDIFNGIIWGCIYGVVGFIIDLVRQRISINKGLHN